MARPLPKLNASSFLSITMTASATVNATAADSTGLRAATDATTLADVMQLIGGDGAIESAARQIPIGLRRVAMGDTLFHLGSPAESIYFIRSGTFKTCRIDEDGYEQVLTFAIRGEVLGWDALCQDRHPCSALALEDSSAYVLLRRQLPAIAAAVPSFSRSLQRSGSLALSRSQELVDAIVAVASEVRLARFLLQLSRQMAASGQSPRRFHLRMGRRDIASLLGVAHETVSRSFTALSLSRLVAVSDREVEILDIDGLRAFARSTRRAVDEGGSYRTRRRVASRAAADGQRLMAAN